jgi:hypothetical protein
MTDARASNSTAILLGVIAAVLIGAGIAVALLGDSGFGSPAAGVLLRTGAVLGAVALVVPVVKQPSTMSVVVAGGGLILVLIRPALIWVALLVWIGWLVTRRQRNTAESDS